MRHYILLLSIGIILIRLYSSSTTQKAELLQSFNDQNRLLRVNDDNSRNKIGLDQYLDPKVVEPREQVRCVYLMIFVHMMCTFRY